MRDHSDHPYAARINRVIDHIDAHLGDALHLQAVAAVADLSPWHFHRVFQAVTGETVADCVRRRRLEVAASRLCATPRSSVLGIALDVGFKSAEVFSRAFRAHFGVSPTEWRRGAYRKHAERHRAALRKIHQGDRKANQETTLAFLQDAEAWPVGRVPSREGKEMHVEIKTLPEVRVAYMRHVGPYGSSSITRIWQRFGAWCAENGLVQPRRRMFGISQDSPEITAPEKCRYDACVEVDGAFRSSGDVGVQTIAGGRYACADFTGTPADIHGAWMRLFGEWLPESRYRADDRPAFELYDTDFNVDEKTGAFSCLLCLPVRLG